MSRNEEHQHEKHRQKWMITCAKLALFALVLWGVRRSLIGGIEQLQVQPITLHFGWLVVAGGLYLFGLLPAGFFWFCTLGALGQRPKLFETLRAYYIGHLGKYVPGKALVVVLRTGLIQSHRVDATLAAVSVFLETLTMMAVGSLIAAVLLGILFHDQSLNVLLAIAMMLASGIPTLPRVFRYLVGRMRITKFNPQVVQKLCGIDFRLMALGWIGMAFGWFLLGLSLWATLRAMGLHGDSAEDLALLTATVALAMVVGFLSLIPGGLGIRDALVMQLVVLYLANSAQIDERQQQSYAVAAAVLLRIVWLVAELLIAQIIYIGGLRSSSEAPKTG